MLINTDQVLVRARHQANASAQSRDGMHQTATCGHTFQADAFPFHNNPCSRNSEGQAGSGEVLGLCCDKCTFIYLFPSDDQVEETWGDAMESVINAEAEHGRRPRSSSNSPMLLKFHPAGGPVASLVAKRSPPRL